MQRFTTGDLINGLMFAIFWASASVAGKFGLQSAEPLVLFTTRFLIAGVVILAYAHLIQKSPLPRGAEWKQLTIFGTLNTALYLGLFVVALQFITPGLTTLSIALNPLFISVLSAIMMRRNVRVIEWISILIGMGGVFVAAYPLLHTSYASPGGLVLLALSMFTYSIGAVYYASVEWRLPRLTINGWQVLIGGILIAPLAWFMHSKENHVDLRFWLSLAWLIFPVSILAVQLWLRLLKTDAVKASLWLYLCPVFGFLYSNVLLHEPLSVFTVIGTVLVLLALYLGQKKNSNS